MFKLKCFVSMGTIPCVHGHFCSLLWCMLCLNTAGRTEQPLRFVSLYSTEWKPWGLGGHPLVLWPLSLHTVWKEDQMHPMPSSGQPPRNSTTLASKGTPKAGLTFLAPDSPDTGCDTWKEFSDSHKVPMWETSSFSCSTKGPFLLRTEAALWWSSSSMTLPPFISLYFSSGHLPQI